MRTALTFACATVLCFSVSAVQGESPVKGVKAVASSEQVAGIFGAQNVVDDKGLSESPPGSGEWVVSTSDYGTHWQSAYLPGGPQESPLIDFDLGKMRTIGKFRVWNHNGQPHRGMLAATIYASDDGKRWRTIERFAFAKATGKDDYAGEEHTFAVPVTTRWLRVWGEGTHRGQGQPDLAGLAKVRFFEAKKKPNAKPSPSMGAFPFDAGLLDVTRAPYGAKGDGVADDTEAIQRAIDDAQGRGRYVYLPAGVYRVTKTLRWAPGQWHGRNNLRGDGPMRTTIQLADGVFPDPQRPQAVLFNGFQGAEGEPGKPAGRVSADWFHNHFVDFTIDVGHKNPGAIGVQFYSNNLGALKNVVVRSADGAGAIGVDLGHCEQNGPLLVKNVTVEGFAIGVRAGATVNSQTIESLRLSGQTQVGVANAGQCLTIRDLEFEGAAPALTSSFGVVTLVDANLRGQGAASKIAAVQTSEFLFARNIRAKGFAQAIEHKGAGTVESPRGETVEEYVSHKPMQLAGGRGRSLGLAIEEPPPAIADDATRWANVRSFRRIDDPDDTAAFQRALDSGASVVYLAQGAPLLISKSIKIPASVRRIVGLFCTVRAVTIEGAERPTFVVAGDGPHPLTIEDAFFEPEIRNRSTRTLVVANCGVSGGSSEDTGQIHLENVVGDWIVGKEQTCWARQMNTEREGVHMTNAGGSLWVLGLKTERGGVLIDTLAGGRTEVLGGLSYTTTAGKLGPMFRVTDGKLSVTLGEVCYTGDPYAVLCEATRAGKTETLQRGAAPLRPDFLQGSALPLLSVGE